MKRIFGLECEYGLTFSPNGRVYLPIEKILGYIFEGLIPNSWPSNAFLTNGARFYQDTGCHPEYATPECDDIFELVVHEKAGERILESCLPAAEGPLRSRCDWPPSSREPVTLREPVPPVPCLFFLRFAPVRPRSFSRETGCAMSAHRRRRALRHDGAGSSEMFAAPSVFSPCVRARGPPILPMT